MKLQRNASSRGHTSTAIRIIYSYWTHLPQDSQDFFDVSPDGRRVAFNRQDVLQANVGMIEDIR